MKPILHIWGVTALLFAIISSPAFAAQADVRSPVGSEPASQTLSGVVRDGSGTVIPRATVVIRQEPSGLERVMAGGADGTFAAPRLPAGEYTITVSAPGFAPATSVATLPWAPALTFTLSPAPIVEQVTVVSASRQQELRETLNSRVDVITRSRIEETGGHETVGEILRELPGVVTRRGSETSGAAGEQIQGIDSRQVLVLVDGQPVVGARGIKRGGVLNLDQYLLGLRTDAPPALARYAKMSHPQPGSGPAAAHDAHAETDGMLPVVSRVPIRMTPALNDHPIVADILASRARAISRSATNEALVIVAHGPNDEDDNRRWLADMASLTGRLRSSEQYASIDYLTLRDDAPRPIRDQAAAALRDLVLKRSQEGRRVLIVPLLVSFGGIERGLRERLEGLTYAITDAALLPDDRLVTWVLARAGAR
ncbi:MAG: TonB-dependent receptor [Acidobacteria bacterium]|nr:TonB-dependent receptor [Acidobacteriota bacterium]